MSKRKNTIPPMRKRRLTRSTFISLVNEDVSILSTKEGERYRDDIEVMKAAIIKDSESFKLATERVQSMKDIALMALKRNGMLLAFLSPSQKSDGDIILAAVSNNGEALQFIPKETNIDYKIAINAVKSTPSAYLLLPQDYKENIRIARTVVSQNPFMLSNLPTCLQDNMELIKVAIKTDCHALSEVPYGIQRNPSILIEVILQDAIYFVQFISKTMESDPSVWRYLKRAIKGQPKSFIEKVLMNIDNAFVEGYAPKENEDKSSTFALDSLVNILLQSAKGNAIIFPFNSPYLKGRAFEEIKRRKIG